MGGGEKNAFSLVNLHKSIPVENIKIKFSIKASKYIEAKKNSVFDLFLSNLIIHEKVTFPVFGTIFYSLQTFEFP